MENTEPVLEFSFQLTRLQRILNPIDRLVVAFLFMLGLIGGAVAFAVKAMTENGVSNTLSAPSFWACFLGTSALWCVIMFATLRHHLISLYLSLSKKNYTNTVGITADGRVFFGCDGIQREMIFPREVQQGLLGTYVISNGGSCWVVLSQEVVALEALQQRIEKKKHLQ